MTCCRLSHLCGALIFHFWYILCSSTIPTKLCLSKSCILLFFSSLLIPATSRLSPPPTIPAVASSHTHTVHFFFSSVVSPSLLIPITHSLAFPPPTASLTQHELLWPLILVCPPHPPPTGLSPLPTGYPSLSSPLQLVIYWLSRLHHAP